MCGRFQVDEKMEEELRKIVQEIDHRRQKGKTGDIYPASLAPVLAGKEKHLSLEEMRWGFPQYQKRGLLINARAESVLEKRTFKDSILHRRCIIPGRCFYEWDKEKNKVTFRKEHDALLYMAGFYNVFEGENRFIILTTGANDSVKEVHERMPLLLNESELESWVYDDAFLPFALQKTPEPLVKHQDYEQRSLLDLV